MSCGIAGDSGLVSQLAGTGRSDILHEVSKPEEKSRGSQGFENHSFLKLGVGRELAIALWQCLDSAARKARENLEICPAKKRRLPRTAPMGSGIGTL